MYLRGMMAVTKTVVSCDHWHVVVDGSSFELDSDSPSLGVDTNHCDPQS